MYCISSNPVWYININSALKVYCGGEKHHPSPFENQPWRNYNTQDREETRKGRSVITYIYIYVYVLRVFITNIDNIFF